ncbi:MAG TPA: hypothetical protein VL527_16860 [Dongiaceae bacterium]|jgi:hypothetical protein|nr:hypothetical protein [Dongiaceae bacterium]
MQKIYVLMTLLVLAAGFTGCGNKEKNVEQQAIQSAEHSFDQAPADLKSKYDEVVAALNANDFPKAKAGLDALAQAELSPEQQQALALRQQDLMLKLSTAAQNGDAAAGKMIQELRVRSRSR